MAMQTATAIKTIERFYLSDLQNIIESTWKATLLKEGFGRFDFDDARQEVYEELEDLLHYYKLMAFYNASSDDLKNRERFIIDYVAPFYTMESLQQVIIPRTSFVPRVVRNVAMLYKKAAQRKIADGEDESPANKVYQEHLKDARIHVKAKQWHRIYTLCDCVAVRPVVRLKKKRGMLQYDVLSPDKFRVLMDDDGNVQKFLYTSTLSDASGGILEDIIVVWTETGHYYRTVKGEQRFFDEQPDGQNPYGEIPWLVIAKDENEIFTGGLSSLADSCLKVNFLGMLESEDSAFAAINIPFGVNLIGKDDTNPKFSPRVPLFINADVRDVTDPKFELVSGTPHTDLLRASADAEEKAASMRQGMAGFMLTDNPAELSGKAMKIALTELREMREDDAMLFEASESELFGKTRVVVNYDAKRFPKVAVIPDGGEFAVDFAEQEYDDDPKLAYELDKMKLADNIISYIDMYRKHNTDMESDEEVEKALAEIKRVNQRMKLPERAIVQPKQIGTGTPPADNPDMPLTPEQMAEQARKIKEAGQ
jgi:hypothetical protein